MNDTLDHIEDGIHAGMYDLEPEHVTLHTPDFHALQQEHEARMTFLRPILNRHAQLKRMEECFDADPHYLCHNL